MKLVTRNVYGSMTITNIPDSSSITTTKVAHIIEHREDDTDFKHEIRGRSVLVANTGALIATWYEVDKQWIYGE